MSNKTTVYTSSGPASITVTPVPQGPRTSVVRVVKTGEVSPNEIIVLTPPLVRPALKPLSIATEPWTSFGHFDTRIFKDDFSHEKHFTAKVKATTVDGATFNYKETANLEKDNALKIKDELKFWFPINYGPQFLHLRVKDSDTRVHYDNGVTDISGEKFNLYGSFGFARDFHNYNFKLGIATIFKNYNTDNRLRITSDHNVAWYHKTLIRQDDIRFGFIGVLDLTKQLLLKKDFLLGYHYKEWDFILKAEQAFDKPTKDFSKFAEWFSNISLTSVYHHSHSQKYALQIDADPTKQIINATALIQFKYNDRSFTKLSLSSKAVLTVLVKKTLSNLWSLSGGAQIPVLGEKGAKTKFGLQVDLNI